MTDITESLRRHRTHRRNPAGIRRRSPRPVLDVPTLHRTTRVSFSMTVEQYAMAIKAAEDRGAQKVRTHQFIAQQLREKS